MGIPTLPDEVKTWSREKLEQELLRQMYRAYSLEVTSRVQTDAYQALERRHWERMDAEGAYALAQTADSFTEWVQRLCEQQRNRTKGGQQAGPPPAPLPPSHLQELERWMRLFEAYRQHMTEEGYALLWKQLGKTNG